MEKIKDVHVFSGAKMNLDSDNRLLKPNELREVYNSMIDVPGSIGCIKKLKGFENVLLRPINGDIVMPSVMSCVGTTTDTKTGSIIYFLCDTVGTKHSILRMFTATKRCEWILKDCPYLNLKLDWKVKAKTIGDLLYWNFGYFNSFLNNDFNPPRKLNIVKAVAYTKAYSGVKKDTVTMIGNAKYWPSYRPTMVNASGQPYTSYQISSSTKFQDDTQVVSWVMPGDVTGYRYTPSSGHGNVINSFFYGGKYYVVTDRVWTDTVYASLNKTGHILQYAPNMYFGIDWQVLDRIKWPPKFAPSASYDSDPETRFNNLRNDMFQFCYRWIYDDNEKSVFSPISDIAMPTSIETINGSHSGELWDDNVMHIWVDTGSVEVVSVEIAVRRGNIGNWTLINRKTKYDEAQNVILQNDIYYLYRFYNNDSGEPLYQIDANRVSDAVPIVSNQMELIEKNRIVDSDYYEGFNNVNIDVSLSTAQEQMVVGKVGGDIDTSACSIRKLVAVLPISGLHISFKYYGGLINMINPSPGITFWEPGFTYIVNISAIPGRYNNPENAPNAEAFLELTYGEYYGRKISSHAVVYSPEGGSFNDFSDSVILQLRAGSSFGTVIGLNNHSYKTFNIYSSIYDFDNGIQNPCIPDGCIGFIIEFVGANEEWGSCVNCAYLNIDILKISGTTVVNSFKSGAFHNFGIVYKDRAGRRSGVNVSDGSAIYVPSQTEFGTEHQIYKNSINWEIKHTPPPEAETYQWVYSKNSSIGYYLYASMSAISNVPRGNNLAASNCTSISINDYIVETASVLSKFSVPSYSWESGDRVRFVLRRTPENNYLTYSPMLDFEILGVYYATGDSGYAMDTATTPKPILDVNGNKVRSVSGSTILVDKFDFNLYAIEADNTIIEIYRPKKNTDERNYYDIGNPIPILNPHTITRRHSGGVVNQDIGIPAKGVFPGGDTYIAFRTMHNSFPCERDSFSDFFQSNCFGIGSGINIVNPNNRLTKYISKLLYSGKYIQNTRVNDLSRVDSSDSVELAEKYGAINSIQEVGYSLKVLQEKKPTTIPISRVIFNQATGQNDVVGTSSKVLGEPIPHDSDYGTLHGESFVKHETRSWFFDFGSMSILRDANNGIQNISADYGIKSFMEERCKLFGSPSNVDIISAYDESMDVVWFSFIDKTTPANSFTVLFRDADGQDRDGFISFLYDYPDFYGQDKYALTSYKNNGVWLHNSDSVPIMNFYGTQRGQKIKIVANKEPLKNKIFKALKIHSNKPYDCANQGDVFVPPNDSYSLGMSSLLKPGAFTLVEGRYCSEFGKNMLTSGATPSMDDYVNGDELRGESLELTLNSDSTDDNELVSVEVNGIYSLKS